MADAASEYLTARSNYAQLKKEIVELSTTINLIADSMRSRDDRFHFTGTSAQFPSALATSSGAHRFPASEWKRADQINELIIRWHDAYHEMNSKWGKVPSSQQQGMHPPLD